MPENGDIPLTGDPRLDAALQRIRGKFRGLEDAMLVQVQLEKRMSERIKEHAQFVANHEQAVRRHGEWLAEVEDKLNLLIDREMRGEGGPETPA
jgi:hypothetical protein